MYFITKKIYCKYIFKYIGEYIVMKSADNSSRVVFYDRDDYVKETEKQLGNKEEQVCRYE